MTVTTGRGRESETERVGEVNRKRKGGGRERKWESLMETKGRSEKGSKKLT